MYRIVSNSKTLAHTELTAICFCLQQRRQQSWRCLNQVRSYISAKKGCCFWNKQHIWFLFFLYFRDSSYFFGFLVLKLRSEYTCYRFLFFSLPSPLEICRICFRWHLGTDDQRGWLLPSRLLRIAVIWLLPHLWFCFQFHSCFWLLPFDCCVLSREL